MFWVDKIAKQIINSGKHQPYWVDDMKTPSGRIHVGALRGVVIHYLIWRALIDAGQKADYTYVFNDIDPMDGFPQYLPEKFKQYMGQPLFKIPSPEPGYESMAQCYAQEFIKVFNNLGIKPKIVWSSQMYRAGKFNSIIKTALDKVELIRKLYKNISGYNKPANWYPFQVICPKCGKVGTTIVTDWDGEKVSFECRGDLVDWAKGCGYQGKISPFDGHGKLMWKVDWPAHWQVMGVTIEWAGKDHMSEGGSYDLSSAICEQVFEYPAPHAELYEWFLAEGGKKMSSSKGVGVSASQTTQILPPELLRFLLTKSHYRRAIIFDPDGSTIPDLFDDYDQAARAYWGKTDVNLARAWELSQLNKPDAQKRFLPRFRDVARIIQDPKLNIYEHFTEQKGSKLTKNEKEILDERIKYAQLWLKKYAPEEKVFKITDNMPAEVSQLNGEQKKYLQEVIKLLEKNWQPENLQQVLYDIGKDLGLSGKQAFSAIYLSLLGKKYGPKAAWLILDNKEKVIKRFNQVIKG